MAKIILGTVVTAISGSIGGNTFRRSQNGLILGRKSMGYSRNKLLSNKSLLTLSQVRNVWNSFDLGTKNSWKDRALLFTFPDRFGNPIKISGYMLFIKSYGTLIFVDTTIPLASSFNTSIASFSLATFSIDYASGDMLFTIDDFSTLQYFFFAFEVGSPNLNAPTFTRRFVCERYLTGGDLTINLFDQFDRQFGPIPLGTRIRLYCTPVNQGGYQGSTIYTEFDLT